MKKCGGAALFIMDG